MPQISFTKQEMATVEEILNELDPMLQDMTKRYGDLLTGSDWVALLRYMRAHLRAVLEISYLSRMIARDALGRGLGNEFGLESFVAASRQAWLDNFRVVRDADRLDEILDRIGAGGGDPVADDLVTLEKMAEHRAFGTLDREYEKLIEQFPHPL